MMTKQHIQGALGLLAVLLLMGLSRISNRYDSESKIAMEFHNLYTYAQPKQIRVFTSSPAVTDLHEREVVMIAFSTSNTKMVYRNDDFLYYQNKLERF